MWRFSAKRTVRLHQVHDASSNHLSYRSLMTNSAPGNVYLQTLFLIAFIMTTAYACGRLVDAGDDATILDISGDAGFASLGPFNRAFKIATGYTPTAYRTAHRARPRAGLEVS